MIRVNDGERVHLELPNYKTVESELAAQKGME